MLSFSSAQQVPTLAIKSFFSFRILLYLILLYYFIWLLAHNYAVANNVTGYSLNRPCRSVILHVIQRIIMQICNVY